MRRRKPAYPTVEFKPTIAQAMYASLGGVLGIGIVELYTLITGGPLLLGVTLKFLAAWLGGAAFGAVVGRRGYGVVLTPWTAEAHNMRRRVIRWPDVRMIQVEKVMFTKVVVIYEFSGRRTRLRAPVTGFLAWDRNFDEKYHAIGRWYLDYRMISPGAAVPEDTPPPGYPINDAVP